MRYWLHAIITILATVLAIAGSCVGLIVFADTIFAPHPAMQWLINAALVTWPLAALFGPTLLMTRVPVHCPKCGGKARFRYYAWNFSFKGNGFKCGPTFAYGCQSCSWCTYYWSSYQEALRRSRAR
jgi:hypothetical protein